MPTRVAERSPLMTAPEPTRRNVRTREFRRMLAALPPRIKEAAALAYEQFRRDSTHPSTAHHELEDRRKGRHRRGSWAVHVTRRYCAIYVPDGNDNVWYWIGSHEDYNNFVGR